MSRAVYLHVGTAKSGTTYLQGTLARNRALMKGHGTLYPGTRPSHFMASIDLRGGGFKGYKYPEAEGAWDKIAAEVRSFDGTALISHETLGNAAPKDIRRAVGSFKDAEVKVVVTCRDLGRQIPAAWQERVKNRNVQTYADYLATVFAGWNGGDSARRAVFWRTQNLIALTARWAEVVGAENVRLVTVPPAGGDLGELWRRFMVAADLPDVDYDFKLTASNASLGTVQTELLRRLNPHFPEQLTWPQYESRIKGRFVLRDLSRHGAGGKLGVPEQYHETTEQIAAQMIESLRDSGCKVIGDLEDLRPSFRPDMELPDDVSTEQLLDLALEVLARLSSRRRPAAWAVSGKDAARILAKKVSRKLPLTRW